MAETRLIPKGAGARALPVPSRGHVGLVVLGRIASGLVAWLVVALRPPEG